MVPPSVSRPRVRDGRLLCVLGPTNTGKTHLAVERMLDHSSGMIGLPLRLLAREIYDRVVRLKGARAVALITGEERIMPPRPAYFVCTVEAMPRDREVAFVAVDEIQLCADDERGHVFTNQLVHARGREETLFMGAETIGPLLRALLPGAEFITRPRFSRLSYTGVKKLSRLPRRSAIVAFSANEVYHLAEMVRRHKGGAAVVMGALSPRTRNAQVALYQDGEVDYLVATDAIGMGLNMDIDHVAFAATAKFDGVRHRALTPAELAQIAGRAGRHMNDGTFGILAGEGEGLETAVVEQIQDHRFAPLRRLRWRSGALDFSSPRALLDSLRADSGDRRLVRCGEADDARALAALARDDAIARRAAGPAAVGLLWQVCQIPDFRKTMTEAHIRLAGQLYCRLMDHDGRLPADWVARQITPLERTDGDVDTLAHRIAHVRTWTYIANRPDWLADPEHWRARARAIEDALSDALHDRLTQRFVDRRAGLIRRRRRQGETPFVAVTAGGEVMLEGHGVGDIEALRFIPEDGVATGRMLAAARPAIRREIAARAARLCEETAEISLDEAARRLLWRGAPLARLAAGPGVLSPRVWLLAMPDLDPGPAERLRRALQGWLDGHLAAGPLAPLYGLAGALDTLPGPARGLGFRLVERLGALPRGAVAREVRALDPGQRRALRRHGVRFGEASIYLPALLKPAAVRLKLCLWAVHRQWEETPAPPPPGRVSLPAALLTADVAAIAGFRLIGAAAVRLDMLERLAGAARAAAQKGDGGGFVPDPNLAPLVGLDGAGLAAVLGHIGYVGERGEDGVLRYRRKAGAPRRRPRPPARPADPASPFASLKVLKPAGRRA